MLFNCWYVLIFKSLREKGNNFSSRIRNYSRSYRQSLQAWRNHAEKWHHSLACKINPRTLKNPSAAYFHEYHRAALAYSISRLVFDTTFRFPAGGDVFVHHARNKRQLSTMIQCYTRGLVSTYHFTSSATVTRDSAVISHYAFNAWNVGTQKKKGKKKEKN